MKLKSSSIYYALFLSLIIALFLGGMILFSSFTRQLDTKLEMQNSLIDNAKSGIEYGLANTAELLQSGEQEVDLFGRQRDSVLVSAMKWGAYTVITSQSHFKGEQFLKVAMIGTKHQPTEYNLYVADLGRPITLSGDTKLEGKIGVPETGLKRGNIAGQPYQNKRLNFGQKLSSARSLPELAPSFIEEMKSLGGEITPWHSQDSLCVSFSQDAIHFVGDSFIALNQETIYGQIIIEARDSIFVGKESELNNVILKSKVVYIEEGFQGTIQVMASQKITLAQNVTLRYPSNLTLCSSDIQLNESACISIGSESQVLGSIIAISESPNFRYPVQIDIQENTTVHGLVYNQGRTQLNGTINGSLFTHKIYLETPSSKYENHLLNAQIKDDLPEDFVFAPIFENKKSLTKIQWLK